MKKTIAFVIIAGLALVLTGCLSSAPTVPVTPANQGQITSCQNTATIHNGVVIGDFVVGGGTAALAGSAAAVTDTQTKTTLGIVGASLGGVLLVGTAVAELTASNFQNSKCGDVVGPLPTASAPAAGH